MEQVQEVSQEEGPEYRRIPIPVSRRSAFQKNWNEIVTPIVSHLKLDIRYNTKANCVELKTNPQTIGPQAMTKAIDFIQAFIYGFQIADAVSLIRLDDIYLDVFDVTDVKMLSGDNLSRAIGRISGKGGQIKYTIENSTRTRISLTDKTVHIIGTVRNVKMAKRVICDLVMGSPANKVYAKLKNFEAWEKRQG